MAIDQRPHNLVSNSLRAILQRSSNFTYAILGTGALGGLYGGLLARQGLAVHFLLRSDFSHVRQHGLQIESPLGNFQLTNINCYRNVEQMPVVDVAIVAWKTTANAALPQALRHVCGPHTAVLVLQNGWDVERSAADCVGAEQVLGGCCFLCCNKVGPGQIQHLDYGRIAFGEYDLARAGRVTPRMEQIAQDFHLAGIEMEPATDLRNVRWRKLMWNIPYNGLSVALNADTSQIMKDPAAAALAESLMQEVRQVAHCCGSQIEAEFVDKLLQYTRQMVPYDSSMRLDYRAGRPMEIEAIFGNTLRAAQQVGDRPRQIEMLYQQLAFMDRNHRETAAIAHGETVAQDPDQSHDGQQNDDQHGVFHE
jgi:2-dehydropantoate 2-reductase